MKQKWLLFFVSALMLTILNGCTNNTAKQTGQISASGTITAVEVEISSETPGIVRKVQVDEGDSVDLGMLLVGVDQEILKAQLNNAEKGITSAEAAVLTAEAALDQAQIQFEKVSQSVHLSDTQKLKDTWNKADDTNIESPEWYFAPEERLAAAKLEMEQAKTEFDSESNKLSEIIQGMGIPELAAAEKRLSNAEEAFRSAKKLRDSEQKAASRSNLDTAADDMYDAAKDELENAIDDYDTLLSDDDMDDLKDARARIAADRLRYFEAVDRYNSLMMSADTLEYQTAQTTIAQAEAAVNQAKAVRDQAMAARDILKVQLTKTEVFSPIAGVVLTRNIEPGEMATVGAPLLVIGQLESLKVTVYVPEDRYGEVILGQEARAKVDSFPEDVFIGKVTHIADQAEYTPRNVQTADGRKTTVFAVEIEIPNPDLKLKPGMPVDVVLGM